MLLQRLFKEANLSQSRQLEILVEAYNELMKENLRNCLVLTDEQEGHERAWAHLEERHGNKCTYMRQFTGF